MANKIVTTDNLKPILRTVGGKVNELEKQIKEPQTLTLENECNDFSVGVDNTGTKYDVIESSESTIELNGRTLVNLVNNIRIGDNKNWSENNGTYIYKGTLSQAVYYDIVGGIKPNSVYTFFINVTKNTSTSTDIGNRPRIIRGETFGTDNALYTNDTGYFIHKINTPSEILQPTECNIFAFNNDSVEYEFAFNSLMVLEGDYTNVPIEYFEGLQSSKPMEIKSVGKNLWDVEKAEMLEILNWNNALLNAGKIPETIKIELTPNKTINFNCTNNYGMMYQKINLEANASYFARTNNLDESQYHFLIYYDNKTIYANFQNTNVNFTVPKDGEYYIGIGINKGIILNDVYFAIEKNNIYIDYEPYKENIVTLPNIEPLRSLPNGVCDEAFIHDDKLVVTRKVGQITITGEEQWSKWNGTIEQNDVYAFFSSGLLPNGTNPSDESEKTAISDKFRKSYVPSVLNTENLEGFSCHKSVYIRILKSKLVSDTPTDLKRYLSLNNFVIAYQLAEPTYEWYELPSPHLYKDGHVFIETGSIPLTTTEHEVNLSLRSAVDTNVEEIVQIKNELNTLDLEIATQEDVANMWQGLLKGGNE